MSVPLMDAVATLYPGAVPVRDYVAAVVGGAEALTAWHLPDPQPTADELAAVTEEQVAAARAAKAREAAKAVLTSTDPVPFAARGGSVALMLSLQEARAKVNEIIAHLNANGATIAPLVTGSSIGDALDDVRAVIDSDPV